MSVKVTTLRLPECLAAELKAVARTDGVTVSDAVREAVGKHIAERRSDEGFQGRLKNLLREDEAVLKRLAEP